MYTRKDFRSLSVEDRYKLIKKEGEYIGARMNGAYRVHLFSYNLYFIEVWILISLNTIQWIEVQENQNILNEYVNDVELKKWFKD